MPYIVVDNISKSFSGNKVLSGINFKISKGEFVVILGKNGSGKTTLLNIVAGIIKPDQGRIFINGKVSLNESFGFVFQNYRSTLLPWRINGENIAFPLELLRINKQERVKEVKNLMKLLGLSLRLDKYPYQSSGGEQQQIVIMREILLRPKLMLMDEPFSALNYEIRRELGALLKRISHKLRLTIIFVTHDPYEARELADRILIIENGKVKEIV